MTAGKDEAARCAASGRGGAAADALCVPAGAPRMCLQPVYMHRFVCDGSRCGSLCCCAKWGVPLDAATLARYEEQPELLQELKKGLERSGATGGWIMRHESERCVFLRGDGLCSLHRRFGIGAISDVCAEYPRKMHEVGDTLDRALCLSCPVAAEEVLFSEESMALSWVEIAAPRPAYVDHMPLGVLMSAAAFRALQLAGIALLQDRRRTLDERLAALGLLLARAEAYVEQGTADALAADAAAIADAAADEAKTLLAANPFDAAVYLRFFLQLFPAAAKTARDDLPETTAYLVKMRSVFGEGMAAEKHEEPSTERAVAALLAHRRRYGAQILARYGKTLEHWLVNEFLLGRYPLMGGTSFLANYEIFVVLYKMLEFLLLTDTVPKQVDAEMRDACESVGEDESLQKSILAAAAWLAVRTNHFEGYIDALAAEIARLLPGDHLLRLLDGSSRH